MVKAFSISLLFILKVIISPCYSEVIVFVNKDSVFKTKTIFVKQHDTVYFKNTDSLQNKSWFEIIPKQLNYDLSKTRQPYSKTIEYKLHRLNSEKTLVINDANEGTKYYGLFDDNDSLVKIGFINDSRPIALCYNNIYQIVVRENDSYLGYLTELINTPFILPPVYIEGCGHQTDLRIGSDCAELAIYGKRRQGYNVPYAGPAGITKYLDEIRTDSLFEGCILHFGFQVSVLYNDKGVKGSLDADDIIIQSYENKACLIEYKNCGYYNYPFKPYKWKL
jgi:hypothetical protein